tara:strand:- start:261156 stop:262310 length:1155 start_codon:yes stop_codon:yes gene_type:complete
MSLKTAFVSRVAERLTGEERLQKKRAEVERDRRARKLPHIVEYFHQADDPYSHLAAQVLAQFVERYDIELRLNRVGSPPDWAAPERERLEAYAIIDAERLARKAGLETGEHGLPTTPTDVRTGIGDARREALGHYLGAMFYYGGEWYWGIDRLHYLEARLTELGARRPGHGTGPIYAPPVVPAHPTGNVATTYTHFDFYLSFRSPYTYISAKRAKALADAYGTKLKLRFVLPMVMRGLPVPKMKSRYITQDTAREAHRLGIPFGRIADPVGRPVERGYSLIPWAREQGLGFEFCHAFLEGVWSRGIDAGSDKGMQQIVETAGLDWNAAKDVIDNDDWRAEAEANRAEMMDLGIWGVPSFRAGNIITWGQDRLWLIEDELRQPES